MFDVFMNGILMASFVHPNHAHEWAKTQSNYWANIAFKVKTPDEYTIAQYERGEVIRD